MDGNHEGALSRGFPVLLRLFLVLSETADIFLCELGGLLAHGRFGLFSNCCIIRASFYTTSLAWVVTFPSFSFLTLRCLFPAVNHIGINPQAVNNSSWDIRLCNQPFVHSCITHVFDPKSVLPMTVVTNLLKLGIFPRRAKLPSKRSEAALWWWWLFVSTKVNAMWSVFVCEGETCEDYKLSGRCVL